MIMFGENISLTFEAVNMDPDRTVVGAPLSFEPPIAAPVTPEPVYSIPTPEPAPSYSIPTPPPTYNSPTPAPTYSIPEPTPSYSAPASNIPSSTLPDYGSPVGAGAPPAKKNNTRTWILAGCGCLLVLLCVCSAAGYWVYSSGVLNQFGY